TWPHKSGQVTLRAPSPDIRRHRPHPTAPRPMTERPWVSTPRTLFVLSGKVQSTAFRLPGRPPRDPRPVNALAAYLDRLHEIHATKRGTPELSYRAALENLLNAVGDALDPAVRATAELADTGNGRPDFGLTEAKSRNLRGVVEVKPVADDVPDTADGKQ